MKPQLLVATAICLFTVLGGCAAVNAQNSDPNITLEQASDLNSEVNLKNTAAAAQKATELAELLEQTVNKPQCYYKNTATKPRNTPDHYYLVFIGIDSKDNAELVAYIFEFPKDGPNAKPKFASVTDWTNYIQTLDINKADGNILSLAEKDQSPTPLDISIKKNSLISFKLLPNAWAFRDKGFNLAENSNYKPSQEPKDVRYSPFFVEPDTKTDKIVHAFYDSKKITPEAQCAYKYDLPLIMGHLLIKPDASTVDNRYYYKTKITIDPIINNDGSRRGGGGRGGR